MNNSSLFSLFMMISVSVSVALTKSSVQAAQAAGPHVVLEEIFGDLLLAEGKFHLKTSFLSASQNQKANPSTAPKAYVITFMSALCPCSDSHIEEIKNLAQTYKDFKFVIIHSNMNESRELAQKYFTEKNLNIPIIEDHKARLANLLKANKTPHTYVLSPEGEMLYRGGVSNSAQFPNATKKFLREALASVSAGQKPKINYGRTLGCQIIRL